MALVIEVRPGEALQVGPHSLTMHEIVSKWAFILRTGEGRYRSIGADMVEIFKGVRVCAATGGRKGAARVGLETELPVTRVGGRA